jgi:hypothetical protein
VRSASVRLRFVTLIIAALCASAVSSAVNAQTPAPAPTPIVLPTMPPNQTVNPYVKMGIDLVTGLLRQEISNSKNTANGQVTYFRRFDMEVRTGANSYREVRLHQGTRIEPLGGNITAGQRVAVNGQGQPDGSLAADDIVIQQ